MNVFIIHVYIYEHKYLQYQDFDIFDRSFSSSLPSSSSS